MLNLDPVNTSLSTLALAGTGPRDSLFSPADDAVVYLLLLLGLKMLVLGGLCVVMLLFILKQRRLQESLRNRSLPARPDTAFKSFFSAPPRWLAVQSTDARQILASLDIRNVKPCAWDDGINASRRQQVFLTPPINGWTLLIGPGLARWTDDPDTCYQFIRDFSSKIGLVQFFSQNQVVNHHSWILANHGDILRAYAWAGETVWNQGPLTAAEKQLGFVCFDYGERLARDESSQADPCPANTEMVHRLAGKWSVDPTTIDHRNWIRPDGMVGEINTSI